MILLGQIDFLKKSFSLILLGQIDLNWIRISLVDADYKLHLPVVFKIQDGCHYFKKNNLKCHYRYMYNYGYSELK